MLLIQFQQTLGFGFLSGQIGKPIDDLLTFFFPLFDEATNDEDLGNPSPFLLKPFVHLRTGPDFSHFQSSMPFVDRFVMVPFPLVKSLVLKKVHEILTHARLVLFRDEKVIAIIGIDPSTPGFLRMYRIGTDDPAFDQQRVS